MIRHHEDVIGLALKDFLSGKKNGKIIVHSPDFEDDFIPVSYYFRDFSEMPYLEQKALKLCEGKILDAGAGAGSHSLYLQDKGNEVVALDSSALACEVMRERGVREVRNMNIFGYRDEKFDTLLMLMNGIGICGSLPGLRKFLRQLPSILKDDGKFIFDSTNLIYLFEEQDGSILMNLNDSYYGEVDFSMEYDNFLSPEFSWLYIDFESLEDLCEEEGFRLELIEEGPQLSYLAQITKKP